MEVQTLKPDESWGVDDLPDDDLFPDSLAEPTTTTTIVIPGPTEREVPPLPLAETTAEVREQIEARRLPAPSWSEETLAACDAETQAAEKAQAAADRLQEAMADLEDARARFTSAAAQEAADGKDRRKDMDRALADERVARERINARAAHLQAAVKDYASARGRTYSKQGVDKRAWAQHLAQVRAEESARLAELRKEADRLEALLRTLGGDGLGWLPPYEAFEVFEPIHGSVMDERWAKELLDDAKKIAGKVKS